MIRVCCFLTTTTSVAFHAPPRPQKLPPLRATKPDQRLATLVSVPVVWGTYAPIVRYVYEVPAPPPPLLFSAAYYVVALATLSTAASLTRRHPGEDADRAGAELGGYLFLGNFAQVLGLQSTTANAAAFLVQLTTIFVPALQAITSGSLQARTRDACALAFAGVAVICGDDLDDLARTGLGDALVVLAALFYSCHVLRLGTFAPRFDPIELALSKAKFETLFAVVAVVVAVALAPRDDYRAFLSADRPSTDLLKLGAATLWCGAMTCAYTIWAQSYGQFDISPARANLVYTSQPIFSSLFAALLVGERPTLATLAGGTLILLAVLVELDAFQRTPPSS
ncbi:hypothetical protein CTAYLR_002680 [Chrysophaeum taylorii]|uniref:EamA domain-containing protein n=1 Tax=Chrysophaeum taylorii TaxID=2483200 RepID=A0AAD7UBH1_9STRA|nr:hypothetical protein CTAYLR_002680 [Chrysophaeum taylorii]